MQPTEHSSIATLVVPAAGLGTRMRGMSEHGIKELLPVGPHPAIFHAAAEAAHAGMARLVVVLRPGKDLVRRYLTDPEARRRMFPRAPDLADAVLGGLEIAFAEQRSHPGECGAILAAAPLLMGEPFAVLYPDNIGRPGPGMLAEILRAHARTGLDTVALMRAAPENAEGISHSGQVDIERAGPDLFNIRSFLPKVPGPFKPRFPNELRTCGLYTALPHYLEHIRRLARQGLDGELTDGKTRRAMLAAGIPFAGAPLSGTVHDVGNPRGYAALLRAWR